MLLSYVDMVVLLTGVITPQKMGIALLE